jgi:hypothetical protein
MEAPRQLPLSNLQALEALELETAEEIDRLKQLTTIISARNNALRMIREGLALLDVTQAMQQQIDATPRFRTPVRSSSDPVQLRHPNPESHAQVSVPPAAYSFISQSRSEPNMRRTPPFTPVSTDGSAFSDEIEDFLASEEL